MLGSRKSSLRGVSGKTTLISQETVVVGDVHFSGTLEIEGQVKGNIVAVPDKDALVRVVGKGRVEGEIHAPQVLINGQVQGNVFATGLLELASKARVTGNVHYASVEMFAGSEVNGSFVHITPDATATAGHADTGS